MSFRTRLTSFFVVIVVVPMLAVGFLVFRLIGDSEQGKADARVNGLASAAASVYDSSRQAARIDAQTIAGDVARLRGRALTGRLSGLASRIGLARVMVSVGPSTVVNFGDRSVIAAGIATAQSPGRGIISVTASELTAVQYARELTAAGVAVVVRQDGRTLGSTLPAASARTLPARGTITLAGTDYRTLRLALADQGGSRLEVTVLSDLTTTTSSAGTSRLVAAFFIAGFLLLAFLFSVLASRALEGQLARFLQAARRLGSGDFSSPIQTEGRDEFAALGEEFNSMSNQLARQIDELGQERARLQESIRRIGKTFAANLDRPALLDLALKTAVDAVKADCGRLSVRSAADEPLAEIVRVGSLRDLEDRIYDAERTALESGGLAETASGQTSIASVALGALEAGGYAQGLITVGRGRPFSDDDREVLRSFASQATLALENVELHFQVRHQAVTDELTGLANHGRFQELLSAAVEQVRRYHHEAGLVMLDIDDFKSINDTYGHQQGDLVLRHVARVLRESSRDADAPARYGGEEMALILPHTDLEGSYAIAERVRIALEALRIRRLDGRGRLRITASLGVAASADGDKEALLARADGALYSAKQQGKNCTIRAGAQTADVFGGE